MIIRQNENGKVNIIAAGTVTRDAVLSEAGVNQIPICKFAIKVAVIKDMPAVLEYCTAWHYMAQDASHIKSGDNVMVLGTETSREYNGNTYIDCNVDYFLIMGKDALSQLIQKIKPKPAPIPAPMPVIPTPMPDMQEMDNLPDWLRELSSQPAKP